MTPSPTISVRADNHDIGFVIERDAGVEAFDLDGKSVGAFTTKDDAARELWRRDRADWITLGEAAERVVQRLASDSSIAEAAE